MSESKSIPASKINTAKLPPNVHRTSYISRSTGSAANPLFHMNPPKKGK